MSIKLASITGVKFGNEVEANYDVIITSISETNNSEETPLKDADGNIVATAIDGQFGDLSIDFKIKGASHLGSSALIGTIINDISDDEYPGPYIVTGCSKTRQEGQWMSGTMQAKNYGAGFVELVEV